MNDRESDADESSATLAYLLVVQPPGQVLEPLRHELQLRHVCYDPWIHLTLRSAFTLNAPLPELLNRLASLFAACRPLVLRSNGWIANPRTRCHLLTFAPRADMLLLHRAVLTAINPITCLLRPEVAQFQGDGYVPHLTLGSEKTASEFAVNHQRLDDLHIALALTVETVELLATPAIDGRLSRGEKQLIRSFPLGG